MTSRAMALGGLLVLLGAAAADVPPEWAPAVAGGAALGILAILGARWRARP